MDYLKNKIVKEGMGQVNSLLQEGVGQIVPKNLQKYVQTGIKKKLTEKANSLFNTNASNQKRNLQVVVTDYDGGEGLLRKAYPNMDIKDILAKAYRDYDQILLDYSKTQGKDNAWFWYNRAHGEQPLMPDYVIGTLLKQMQHYPDETLEIIQNMLGFSFNNHDPLKLNTYNLILIFGSILSGNCPSVQNAKQFEEIANERFGGKFVSNVASKIDLTNYFKEVGERRSQYKGPNGEKFLDYYSIVNKPVDKPVEEKPEKPNKSVESKDGKGDEFVTKKPVENKPIEKKDEPLVKNESDKKLPKQKEPSNNVSKYLGAAAVLGMGGVIYKKRKEIYNNFFNKPNEQQGLQQINRVVNALTNNSRNFANQQEREEEQKNDNDDINSDISDDIVTSDIYNDEERAYNNNLVQQAQRDDHNRYVGTSIYSDEQQVYKNDLRQKGKKVNTLETKFGSLQDSFQEKEMQKPNVNQSFQQQ